MTIDKRKNHSATPILLNAVRLSGAHLSGKNRLLPQPAAAADAGARDCFCKNGGEKMPARGIVFAKMGKMQGAEGEGKEFTLRK